MHLSRGETALRERRGSGTTELRLVGVDGGQVYNADRFRASEFMKLYTKTGDAGETSLCNGQRVGKDHLRIAAYGDVDELNAVLGLALCACEDAELAARMRLIQDRLFVVGAELSNPDAEKRGVELVEADVTTLEGWIDEAWEATGPLQNFILPGGTELSARLHVARTVCRRAERLVVALARAEEVGDCDVRYLNRLSDLLFAWARLANHLDGTPDIVWRAP